MCSDDLRDRNCPSQRHVVLGSAALGDRDDSEFVAAFQVPRPIPEKISTRMSPHSRAVLPYCAIVHGLKAAVAHVSCPVEVCAAAEPHFLVGENLRFKSARVFDSEHDAVLGPVNDVRIESKRLAQLVREVGSLSRCLLVLGC